MDVICEACGELNVSAGEFCNSCGAFLAWEEGAATKPPVESTRSDHAPAPAGAVDDQATVAADHDRRPAGDRQSSDGAPADAAGDASAATAVLTQPVGPRCPLCGLSNDPGRRFCAHCGEQLAPSRDAVDRPQPDRAQMRRRERTDRRAYAATLPPLYRWGRIGLAAVVAALVITLVILVGTDPLGWARGRWHDLRGTVVAVPGVQATVVGQAADGQQESDPAALVDGSAAEWSTAWSFADPASTCGGAPGTAVIELTLAQSTRIRALDIRAGLGEEESDRPLQFRPKVIGVVADDGTCRAYPLVDTAEPQRLDVDTEEPVSVIRIGVDSAYPPRADGQQRLSITEITLLSRPQ